jgi:hypothetical protein
MENIVGLISKKFGLLNDIAGKATSFEVKFPNDSTVEDKLTIMGISIMLYYRSYENNPCK